MSLLKKIEKWFEKDGNFIAGTGLLMLAGEDTTYFQTFFQYDYLPIKVEEELKNRLIGWMAMQPEEELSENTENHDHRTNSKNGLHAGDDELFPVDASPPLAKDEPAEIKGLREQAKALHKEQAYWHACLAAVTDDEARLECAQKIMIDVIPALDAKYDAIREWESTGEVPGQAARDDDFKRGVDMMKRLANLKSRVSRLKGMLKKELEAGERGKYDKEFMEKEIEIKGIEKEIS
jgi:hypothetical protein